jgi:glycosyltransferase involved in cell wall biosynthesis
MPKFHVVINCGPCAPFIGSCLASLESQTYDNWRALVTVDPCGDDTYGEALAAAQRDRRIAVCQNSLRCYALENLVRAVRQTSPDPEDVIVILDGDDRLNVHSALSTIAETYNQHACWSTYGSWVSNVPERHSGKWPAYPACTKNFRAAPWLATHLRTWKRWLWDLVKDDDLRDDEGRYFRVAVDLAVMLPLLEICGTERALHIAEPIYFLNRQYEWRTHDQRYLEQQRNDRIIRSRSPYQRRYSRPI